ncbi:Homocysteine-responsive endoplasmic reticulum-resident ubiquitin-like domain member 2 protein [Nymphon striatum]|nr:Homocysteine-responsive endoplasmic reticulum-resident ubiquitin-like domain member 2 protein [Nymphon striatum]
MLWLWFIYMEQNISLVIKAPMQSLTDFVIKCSEDWTVLKIKTHLSEVYQGNPGVDTQRLIYSGRLLQDNLSIKDFIRKFDDNNTQTHVLHLVCSTVIGQSSGIQPPVMNTPNLEIPSVPTSLNLNTNPMNQQFIAGPEMIAHQMAMYHQLYAQYLALYPNFAFQTQFATVPVAPSQPVIPMAEQPPALAEPAEVNNDNNNEQPRAAPMRMNPAQGVDDDDEGAGRRDWLDWFYVVIRAMMLLFILYLYSSLGRFLVFVGTTVVVYLYHNRNVLFNNAQREQQPEPPQPAEQLPQDPQQQEQENQTPDDAQTSEADGSNENTSTQEPSASNNEQNEDNVPNRPLNFVHRLFKSIWMIIFSFIRSLIPDPPAAVAQN